MENLKAIRRLKIRNRIRKHVCGTATRPRLAVYKSNRAIYAQLIDDIQGHTLAASSSRSLGDLKGISLETAKKVGENLAQKALAKGIYTVSFDRSGYIYHGRIKALAEATRAQGIKFEIT